MVGVRASARVEYRWAESATRYPSTAIIGSSMMRTALLPLLVAASIGSFVGCKKAPPAATTATAATPLARTSQPVAGQPAAGQPAAGQTAAGQPAAGQSPALKPMPAQIPDGLGRVNRAAIERRGTDQAGKRM